MPGRWNFPGGRVEERESVHQGAVREVEEEAGFTLPSVRWLFSYRHHDGVTHIFYSVLDHRPEVTMPDGEHDAYMWVPLTSIPEPAIPHIKFVVDHVIGVQRWNMAPADRSTRTDLSPIDNSALVGESDLGGPMHFNPSPPWPARWPGYLPYPTAIGRSKNPVPNADSVHWATAQFAPDWLPPGSRSYQPYVYPDGDLMQNIPLYTAHHSGDLHPFTPHPQPTFLHTQDFEALAASKMQQIVDSSWLEGKASPLESFDPPCGCGPTYDCGCGGAHAKDNEGEGGFFTDEEGNWHTGRVATAVVAGMLAVWYLRQPRAVGGSAAERRLEAERARAAMYGF
jgi:hypothetical protein